MTASHASKCGIILCKHQLIILSAPAQGNFLQAFPCSKHVVSTNIHTLLTEKHTQREEQENSFGAFIFYLTYLAFISIFPPKKCKGMLIIQGFVTILCYFSNKAVQNANDRLLSHPA